MNKCGIVQRPRHWTQYDSELSAAIDDVIGDSLACMLCDIRLKNLTTYLDMPEVLRRIFSEPEDCLKQRLADYIKSSKRREIVWMLCFDVQVVIFTLKTSCNLLHIHQALLEV